MLDTTVITDIIKTACDRKMQAVDKQMKRLQAMNASIRDLNENASDPYTHEMLIADGIQVWLNRQTAARLR